MNTTNPRFLFREARERMGLSVHEVATRCGVGDSCIWDIEECDDELESCYSPIQIQKFCQALGIRPIELFGAEISESAVSAIDLVQRIQEECRSRNVTLEQFEDAVGW